MSIAYVVLAHRAQPQVVRLVSRLLTDDPEARALVHLDARVRLAELGVLSGHPRGALLPRRATGWGSWSLVEAIVDGLRLAIADASCSYVSVLSGADYPVRRVDGRLAALESYSCRTDAGFVTEPERRHKAARYQYAWHQVPGLPAGTLRSRALARVARTSRGHVAVLTHAADVHVGLRRELPDGLTADRLATGEMWFDVSRAAATAMLSRIDREPELVRHFRRTWIPDEGFLQTLLLNGPGPIGPSDRNIRWTGGAHHPDVLDVTDVEELLVGGESFARKFDDSSTPALDRLDRAAGYPGPVPLPAT
jgi:hypothetical protein